MKDIYEVIAEYETCHHNHGADWASYTSDYITSKHSTYSEALKAYNERVEDHTAQLFIMKNETIIKQKA